MGLVGKGSGSAGQKEMGVVRGSESRGEREGGLVRNQETCLVGKGRRKKGVFALGFHGHGRAWRGALKML